MYEVEWKFNKETEHFPNLFHTLEPQFLIEKDFHHLVPQSVPKPIKTTKRKNVRKKSKSHNNKEKLDVVDMLKKITLDASVELNSSALQADSSLLDLSGGTDDSDMSAIINNICDRKKRSETDKYEIPNNIEKTCHDQNSSFSSPSRKTLVACDLSDNNNDLIKRFELLRHDERPLPNFSLNLSLEKFLETSSHCHQEIDKNAKMFSTPLKRSLDSKEQLEQDSFSTPSPLAERFSRLHV